MLQKDFLEKREKKLFTIKDVQNIAEQLGYKHQLVETHCTGPGHWTSEAVKAFREELARLNLTYFAYIKFYQSGEEENKYALVAGKTNSWKDDVYFEDLETYKGELKEAKDVVYHRADKAKKWLAATDKSTWYHEKVLIIYCPEPEKKESEEQAGTDDLRKSENLAYSIEADIGGLLGLYSS